MRTNYEKKDLGKSFVLAVGVMLLAQMLLSLIFGGIKDESSAMPNWAFWLMQALYTLCIGSVAPLYAVLCKTNFVKATTIDKAPKIAHIGWGCLAGIFLIALMLPINEWFLDLIELTGLKRPSVDMPMEVVPMIFVSCLLPAVTEEITFRGTVAQSLATSKNKWAALAISGALFSIFHLNPAQTVHQFVLGAFLTLLAYRSGSIWTGSVVHLFNNLVAVVLMFTADETVFTNYGYLFVPIGLVGFVGCVYGYLRTTKSSWQCDEQQQVRDSSSLAMLVVAVTVCVALWILNLVV